jgi:hypothetical protein
VARVTTSITKLRPFLIASDWRPVNLIDRIDLRSRVSAQPVQMELFG